MRLKGTKTERNLLVAFAGESQARNRYSYFAARAHKDGYPLIEAAFEDTANHEKEHAKRLFKFLEGREVEITTTFPGGVMNGTLINLRAAAETERHEHAEVYPAFARTAEDEGFPDVAEAFRAIAVAEGYHLRRFQGLARALEEERLFSRDTDTVWRCRKCGHLSAGRETPAVCPACDNPREYYEEYTESGAPTTPTKEKDHGQSR